MDPVFDNNNNSKNIENLNIRFGVDRVCVCVCDDVEGRRGERKETTKRKLM